MARLSLFVFPLLVFAIDPPPPTRQQPVSETLHGVTLTDPYRWLEDQNAPQTRAWLQVQNDYTEKFLASLAGREAMRKRLEHLFRYDDRGAPIARGGRYFYTRRLASENRDSICLKEGVNGAERVLIDVAAVSRDESVSIARAGVSDDGALLYYSVRQGGEDEVELRIHDVIAGRDLSDRLPRARYFGWAGSADKTKLWYSRLLKEGTRVFEHKLGTNVADDKVIFGLGKGLVPFDRVFRSEDGRWLGFSLGFGSTARNEIRVMDLAKPGEVKTVVSGVDASFSPYIVDGGIYLRTNWKAPNWRLLRLDLSNPSLDRAVEIIPEGKRVLEYVNYAGGKLFASYFEDVRTRIEIFSPEGKPLGSMKLPGLGSTSAPSGRWKTTEAFYGYSSFTEPSTIYRYDTATGRSEIWRRTPIPVKSGLFETKQVWFVSKDSTRVPMFLVHRKGLKLDGERPVYLTGYGGFNLSQLPGFSSTATTWADLGGVYALPNLRGGGEFGEAWHKAGMLEKKQNVFDDFFAAADWLIRNGYTRPARIAIAGGSNGGLLVGAGLTQRPGLFGAVLCSVPLLDMVRYHKFLLGPFWVTEYGSSEDPTQFEYILKYSPYHKVEKGAKYPAIMFASGDSDTRVDPLHARKMAALVQSASGSGKPVLLKYDTKAGHSGGKPVTQEIADAADGLLFLWTQLGGKVE